MQTLSGDKDEANISCYRSHHLYVPEKLKKKKKL